MIRLFSTVLAFAFAMTFLAGNSAQAAGDKLVIELKTGKVVIQLRPDLAPKHVERVKTLAAQGFYNGIKWHRVIDGFMAQTGDPTGTGMGGSKLPDVKAEFSDTHFGPGIVGAARSSDPDSFNSQFFITFADAGFLDGQYTVFGKVVDGMDHVNNIKKGDPQTGQMDDPDKILSAKIVYK